MGVAVSFNSIGAGVGPGILLYEMGAPPLHHEGWGLVRPSAETYAGDVSPIGSGDWRARSIAPSFVLELPHGAFSLLVTKNGALVADTSFWMPSTDSRKPNPAFYRACPSGTASQRNSALCRRCHGQRGSFSGSFTCYMPSFVESGRNFLPVGVLAFMSLVAGRHIRKRLGKQVHSLVLATSLIVLGASSAILSFQSGSFTTPIHLCGWALAVAAGCLSLREWSGACSATQGVLGVIVMLLTAMTLAAAAQLQSSLSTDEIIFTLFGNENEGAQVAVSGAVASIGCFASFLALCLTEVDDVEPLADDFPSKPLLARDVLAWVAPPLVGTCQSVYDFSRTSAGLMYMAFVNFTTTFCTFAAHGVLQALQDQNYADTARTRQYFLFAILCVSCLGCFVSVSVLFGYVDDTHLRKVTLIKSVMAILKVLYLVIPGSFQLDPTIDEQPFAIWQCVAGGCPSMCTRKLGGTCTYSQANESTTCVCEFLGVEDTAFRVILIALVLVSALVMLGMAWVNVIKLYKRGKLSLVTASGARVAVPYAVSIAVSTSLTFWGALAHKVPSATCFGTGFPVYMVAAVGPTVPLSMFANEMKCFLGTVQAGTRARTVSATGGILVLRCVSILACFVCGIIAGLEAERSADKEGCAVGSYFCSVMMSAAVVSLLVFPHRLAAPAEVYSPDAMPTYTGVLAESLHGLPQMASSVPPSFHIEGEGSARTSNTRASSTQASSARASSPIFFD